MKPLEGRPLHPRFRFSLEGKKEIRILVSLSAFHASMVLLVEQAIFTESTCILTPLHLPHPAFTSEAMTKWVQKSRCDTLMAFPSRVESAIQDEKYAAELRKLEYISTGGGEFRAATL